MFRGLRNSHTSAVIMVVTIVVALLQSCAPVSNEQALNTLPANTATLSPSSTFTSTVTASIPTRTVTRTPLPTSTQTPKPTSTSTITSTPKPTLLPPATLTFTPAPLTVGRYPQNACATYLYIKPDFPAFEANVNWCVLYVELQADRMEFRVSWEVTQIKFADRIQKHSDEYNRNMYLTDIFGNRYDHIAVSDAAHGGEFQVGTVRNGSFFYSLPSAGARNFVFHDDDNHVVISVILATSVP